MTEAVAVIGIDEYIKTEIARFNVADAAIDEMKNRFMSLTINGVDDREGYKAVRESRLLVKGKRIEVERIRKSIKEDSLKFGRAVDGEAKRITALLEPIEDHLEKQEKAIDEEKEHIKAEQERLEHEKVQGRMAILMSLGVQFTGFSYVYGEHSITSEQLKAVSDGYFSEFCGKIRAEVEAEQARLAEEERVKKEADEAERLRLEAIEKEKEEARRKAEEIRQAELKAEEERLAKIKAEQEETARIQAEKDAAFAAEKAAFEAEKKAAEDARLKEEAEKKRLSEEEQARKDAEEKARAEAEEQAKRDEEARLESERQVALRAAHEDEMRPDREKLKAYADKLEKVAVPKIKTTECVKVLNDAHEALLKVVKILQEG